MARRRSRVAFGPQRRGFGNWIIGGTKFDGAGAPSSFVSWGNGLALVAGAAVSFTLAASPDYDPGSSTPKTTLIGEMEVDAVEGTVNFVNPSGNTNVGVVVAIYLAKQLSAASTSIGVVDPTSPADAMHDDFLFLRGFSLQGVSATANTAPISMPLSISRPCIVPSGHVLVCTVGITGASATLAVEPFVRTHVRRSA